MDEAASDVAAEAAEGGAYTRLQKELTAVKNDIAHLSQQIADAVNALATIAQRETRRGMRRARENVDTVVSDASERAGAVASAAQEAASSLQESLEEVIEERPLTSVAIALAIGFLVGVTWRR
jgi:ElaB/YqjD/DUF883 family membrane-anchored ribosome-binding protein